jgi:hypothetical protein
MGRLKSFFHDEIVEQSEREFGPSIPHEAYDNVSIDGKPLLAVIIKRDTTTGDVSLCGAYTDRMDAEQDLSLLLMGKRVFATPDYYDYFIRSIPLTESGGF